ncbi:MAG TPA: hypothetical protein VGF55_08895 [Gemmataceae bacterium]|jgi:hypothetical protein
MRRAAFHIGGLVGWLGLAGGLLAADTKDATVRVPTAEVRGGRSEIFPITGYLRQGQSVHIEREEDGYYAVVPPPGSSSWIEDHALQFPAGNGPRRGTTAVVLIEGAQVRLGSGQVPKPLPYETVRLNRGTIVRISGDKAFAEGKEWWRIQPPPTEVRYVAKDAVAVQTSTVVSSSPAGTSGPPQSLPNQPTHRLWVEAQQAERVGDYAKAETKYRELAGEMAQPGGDHDLAIRCYNRIEQLSRAQTATWPARQPAPGMLVSGRPAAVTPAPAAASGTVSSGPGWLRRTGIVIDGKRAFVLEDDRSQPRYYLLAQPGLNLEPYVNRPVEVFGPLVQRPDLAGGGYLSVNRLHLLR